MKTLTIFRIIAFLEGLSYILLLFVGVPLKYIGNDVSVVKMLGMPHGILFVAYVALAILFKKEFSWTNNQFLIVLLAAIIPFGTFYIDRKYLKSAQ